MVSFHHKFRNQLCSLLPQRTEFSVRWTIDDDFVKTLRRDIKEKDVSVYLIIQLWWIPILPQLFCFPPNIQQSIGGHVCEVEKGTNSSTRSCYNTNDRWIRISWHFNLSHFLTRYLLPSHAVSEYLKSSNSSTKRHFLTTSSSIGTFEIQEFNFPTNSNNVNNEW